MVYSIRNNRSPLSIPLTPPSLSQSVHRFQCLNRVLPYSKRTKGRVRFETQQTKELNPSLVLTSFTVSIQMCASFKGLLHTETVDKQMSRDLRDVGVTLFVKEGVER